MSEAAWQRKQGRRWRLIGLAAFGVYLGMYIADVPLSLVPGALAVIAGMLMQDAFGWAEGWETRNTVAVEMMRDRIAGEVLSGAPAAMVALHAAIEAEHILAGHDGDAQECGPCNDAGTAWLRRRRREWAAAGQVGS